MMRHGPPDEASRRRFAEEGELEVFVADEQDGHPVEVARWARLAEQVIESQGVTGDAELSIMFVTEAVIADLNGQFMGQEGPTDVLAFPIDDDVVEMGRFPDSSTSGPDRPAADPADAPLLLGDVVICPAVAARNAPSHAGTYEDEIALLVVHGILHVLGMDHAEPDEAAAMQARERELLGRFHATAAPGAPPEMPDHGTSAG
ncbi:MAG: putative rRNA maturation factor YbeY [Acidimicrobiales bacterium]|nr:putative rRNA maturation factor YbeY [Acidimicrobiales bacterium]